MTSVCAPIEVAAPGAGLLGVIVTSMPVPPEIMTSTSKEKMFWTLAFDAGTAGTRKALMSPPDAVSDPNAVATNHHVVIKIHGAKSVLIADDGRCVGSRLPGCQLN